MLRDSEWDEMTVDEKQEWLRWQIVKLTDAKDQQRRDVKFATDQFDALAHDTIPDIVRTLKGEVSDLQTAIMRLENHQREFMRHGIDVLNARLVKVETILGVSQP